MIAALSFIANGFMISMSERTRYLGILASVGTTAKQKRSSVYFEGVIAGLIGIPMGLIVGISTVGGGIELVSCPIMRETNAGELRSGPLPRFMAVITRNCTQQAATST